jgi:O-antigen/teichoic acid export membrane protein
MNVPRKSVAYNGFFSLLDKGYTALSGLALIPFIVHHLGMETYGIWVVLTAVGSYFGLGSFGINSTFEKYIAQYNAVHDERSMRRFLVTALYTSIAMGAGIFIVSIFCADAVFHLFLKNVSPSRYTAIFYWVMSSWAFSLATMIFLSIPRGLQRYDFSSGISIIARTFYILAVIVLCIKGFGLYSLIAAQYAFIVVGAALSLIVSRRFLVRLSFNPALFDWSIFRRMFSFGSKIQVSLVVAMIIQSFDKLLIAHFFGASLVAIYDIGSRLVMFLKDLPTFFFASMTSRTSELHSLNHLDRLKQLYLAGTKYMAVLCFGAVAFLFPVATEILNVWMRRPIDPLSIYVFQVLLVSTMVNAMTGLGTSIVVGIGKPEIIIYPNVFMAIVNIICSTAFFFAFGPKGVVWGTAAGLLVSSVLYFWLLNRSMDVRNRALWSSISIPFLVNTVATLGLVKLHDIGAAAYPALFSGIGASWAVIAVNSFLVLAISVGVYGGTKFITMGELQEYLPFLKRPSES